MFEPRPILARTTTWLCALGFVGLFGLSVLFLSMALRQQDTGCECTRQADSLARLAFWGLVGICFACMCVLGTTLRFGNVPPRTALLRFWLVARLGYSM